jgi:hypothetical protein
MILPSRTIRVVTLVLTVVAIALSACATAVPDAAEPTQPPPTTTAQPPTPTERAQETAPTATASPTLEPAPTSTLQPAPTATAVPPPDAPAKEPVALPEGAAPLVALARADLTAHLGADADQIALLSVEAVEWRDASLGCPQPGMMYAQVITPGYRVVLGVGSQTYEYHTSTRTSVVLCETAPPAQIVPGSSADLPLYLQVVQFVLMPGATAPDVRAEPPPNDRFTYDAVRHALLLSPSTAVAPGTALVVGQTSVIQEPNQAQVSGELFQVPPTGSTGVIDVLAVDAQSSALSLVYGEETVTLLPGETRSFKEAAGQATRLTTLTHRGRLTAVEPFPYAPGGR